MARTCSRVLVVWCWVTPGTAQHAGRGDSRKSTACRCASKTHPRRSCSLGSLLGYENDVTLWQVADALQSVPCIQAGRLWTLGWEQIEPSLAVSGLYCMQPKA